MAAYALIADFNQRLSGLTPEERVLALEDMAFCTACGHEHDYNQGCTDPSECEEACCEAYED